MKTFTYSIILCLLFSFQQTAFAQTTNSSTFSTKTISPNSSSVDKASKQSAAARNEINAVNGKKTSSQQANKIVYGYLSVDKEGTVLFDRGNGEEKLINPENNGMFRSIISGLNYLSYKEKWQVSHTYSLTNGSPNPAFILYRYTPVE